MTRRTILTALLLAASAATLVAFARPAPVAGAWEYRVVRGAGIDLAASGQVQDEQMAAAQGLLNGLGAEGWELQAIQGPFAVLKRLR